MLLDATEVVETKEKQTRYNSASKGYKQFQKGYYINNCDLK